MTTSVCKTPFIIGDLNCRLVVAPLLLRKYAYQLRFACRTLVFTSNSGSGGPIAPPLLFIRYNKQTRSSACAQVSAPARFRNPADSCEGTGCTSVLHTRPVPFLASPLARGHHWSLARGQHCSLARGAQGPQRHDQNPESLKSVTLVHGMGITAQLRRARWFSVGAQRPQRPQRPFQKPESLKSIRMYRNKARSACKEKDRCIYGEAGTLGVLLGCAGLYM